MVTKAIVHTLYVYSNLILDSHMGKCLKFDGLLHFPLKITHSFIYLFIFWNKPYTTQGRFPKCCCFNVRWSYYTLIHGRPVTSVRRSARTLLHKVIHGNIYCEYIMFPPLRASRPSAPSHLSPIRG